MSDDILNITEKEAKEYFEDNEADYVLNSGILQELEYIDCALPY